MARGATVIEAYEKAEAEASAKLMSLDAVFRRIVLLREFVDTKLELDLILFIADRTARFGKLVEVISEGHFLSGIGNPEMDYFLPPIECSRATLYRALKKLTATEIIITRARSGRPTAYGLNPLWSYEEALRRKLKGKKRVKSITNSFYYPSHSYETPLSHLLETPLSHRGETHKVEIYKGKISNPAAEAVGPVQQENSVMSKSAMEALAGVVAGARGKTADAREKRKTKGGALAFARIWEDAWKSAYPDDQWFAWTQAQQAMVKRALSRGVPVEQQRAFVEYIVVEFADIVRSRFSWMRSPPTLPKPEFVVKHIQAFYSAFQDKDDPNRKLRRDIRNAPKVLPKPKTDDAEVERLKQELAKAQAENKRLNDEKTNVRAEAAGNRAKQVRRLVTHRKKSSEEFGSWDE